MMSVENEAAGGQLSEASEASEARDEARECVRLFCDTVAELDRIYERHADWIVRMAMLTVEVAASSPPSASDAGGEGAAERDGDKLAALAEQARAAAERGIQSYAVRPPETGADAEGDDGGPDVFCREVRRTLILALQNSLSSQQVLNQLGVGMVGACGDYLLTPRAPASKDGGSQADSK